MTVKCNFCNKENADDALVCARCGVELVKASQPMRGTLELRVIGMERASINVAPPAQEGYIIGRSDDSSDYIPDIDLSQYGARQHGVSRRHAALIYYRKVVNVIDLESINGTYLNGKKLIPNTPYPLNSGDSLKLGTFGLLIK